MVAVIVALGDQEAAPGAAAINAVIAPVTKFVDLWGGAA